MSAQDIVESAVYDMIDLIKAEIPAALAEVRAQRTDGAVTTEAPVSYFIYEPAIGYKTPAIFTVATDVDYRLLKGPNSINALITILVSCLVEDRNAELLTLKSYRYHDALHKVLDRAHLVDASRGLQNIIKVTRSDFSRTEKVGSSIDSIFRKEVMLTCEVEHYGNEN